ncbi:hypothetical protein HanRHA438_Chr14g0649291 [Helianthus annuus]|nr:hypothetical protein HanRHA438_Chr14g0649291 [Helianthus annuus]
MLLWVGGLFWCGFGTYFGVCEYWCMVSIWFVSRGSFRLLIWQGSGKLLGYCIDTSPFQRMLVFEYASNGTLYEHLHCKSIFILFMSKYMPFDAVRKQAG